MKNLIFVFVLSTLLIGCNTATKQTEEQPLMDQVMDVHDAVMPKMGDLMKTKKLLMAKADAIMETDPAAAAELKLLAEEVELASESMMDWMRNFDPNFEGTEEEVKAYLMKKKQGIEKVANAMNTKLEEGKKALQ